MGQCFDIICFSHQWDKYRRRYQSIMLELAKREEIGTIFFIETPLTLTSFINFKLGSTGQYTAERWERFFSSGQVFQEGKIVVVTPLALIPFDRIEALQPLNIAFTNFSRRRLVDRLVKKYKLKNTVLWINHPYYVSGFVGKFNERLFCYDLCDDHTEFYRVGSPLRRRLEREDERISAAADLVFVVSEDLERKKKAMGKAVWRIPNAVDIEYFEAVFAAALEPPDLVGLGRPRLGYVGKITHRTDTSMVEYAARAHPEWSVALIGPISPGTDGVDRLRELENVAFLGEKPYAEVPAYLKYIDVCIMPHKVNSLTTSQDPLKFYSYLASGKPVVCTGVAGVEAFSQVVRIVDSKEGFVTEIEAALAEDGREREAKQLALAGENSWTTRVEKILKLMMASLEGAPTGGERHVRW